MVNENFQQENIMPISPLNEVIRRVVLAGVVGEESAAQFLEQLTTFEYIDISKPVMVYIDTYGGNVDSAMLIYDAIRTCQCPITTVGIGKVMSAGSLILAAGDPGNRLIARNTRVMIHQVAGGVHGTVSELNNELEEMSRMQEQYLDLLSFHTGRPKKQILEDISDNKYMTAQEAIDYGIADAFLAERKVKEVKKIKAKVKGNRK